MKFEDTRIYDESDPVFALNRHSVRKGQSVHFAYYDNLQEVETAPIAKINKNQWDRYMRIVCSYSGYRAQDWLGCDSVSQVIDFVTNGWAAGVDKGIAAQGKFAPPKIKYIRRKRKWSDQGDHIDIHRVNSGNIDRAWQRAVKTSGGSRKTGRNVVIAVDIAGNCNVSSESLFWAGAAASVMASNLVVAGYNVAVVSYHLTSYQGSSNVDYSHMSAMLKGFDEPLDLSRLYSTTALAGFFRYYSFRMKAASDAINLPHHFGYSENNSEIASPFWGVPPKDILWCKHVRSLDQAAKWIASVLNLKGIAA